MSQFIPKHIRPRGRITNMNCAVRSVVLSCHVIVIIALVTKMFLGCFMGCPVGVPTLFISPWFALAGITCHFLVISLWIFQKKTAVWGTLVLAVGSAIMLCLQVYWRYECWPCFISHFCMGLASCLILPFVKSTLLVVSLFVVCLGVSFFQMKPNVSVSTGPWPQDCIGGTRNSERVAMCFLNPECPACREQWKWIRADLLLYPNDLPVVVYLLYHSSKGQALNTLAYASARLGPREFQEMMDVCMNDDRWQDLEPQETLRLIPNALKNRMVHALKYESQQISERMTWSASMAHLVNLRYEPTAMIWKYGDTLPEQTFQGLTAGRKIRNIHHEMK